MPQPTPKLMLAGLALAVLAACGTPGAPPPPAAAPVAAPQATSAA